jgi:hypothetical protein
MPCSLVASIIQSGWVDLIEEPPHGFGVSGGQGLPGLGTGRILPVFFPGRYVDDDAKPVDPEGDENIISLSTTYEEGFWVDLAVSEVGWVSIQDPSGRPTAQPKPNDKDACSAMADKAQLVADSALQEAKGRGALKLFDRRFSRLYLGNDGVGETLSSAWEFSKLNVRYNRLFLFRAIRV